MDNGTLLAVKFKDRSVFQMLSSVHSVADVEVGQNHPRTGLQIAKPEIIHDYNKFKGAVDRCDQMVAYSCFRRNTMKWWKKVFFHLFSLSILNASILYKQRTQSPGCKGPFKRSLLRTLASPILSLREATQEPSRRLHPSSSWRSLPRENTGHQEEVQHHPGMWGLLSCPKEDSKKDRR